MSVVVNFLTERERLQPFRWQSDLWIESCIKVAKTHAKWRPVLPELYAEQRRRQRHRPARPVERTRKQERCGADGGDHDWVVDYWIGGEPHECGEQVYCRKCREEYVR